MKPWKMEASPLRNCVLSGGSALLGEKGEDELIWMAVDSSVVERPDAHTSQDRGIIHLSNLPLVDQPIGVGWTFSTVVLLPEQPSSWAPILEQQRVPTEQTPVKVAVAQLRALKPLLGKRPVLVLADRGYCTAEFLRACHDLGISVIVRMKSDRRLYRPGVRRHTKGPLPKDGPVFQGKRQETHGIPEAQVAQQDAKGRTVRTSSWSTLHFKEDRELAVKVIRVERESAKDTKRDPRVSWFVMLDEVVPLKAVAPGYGLRFSEGGTATAFSNTICCGRVPMSVPPRSLSAGVGWWPPPSTNCAWHALWQRPCIDHGNAKSARSPPGRSVA